MCVCWGGGEGQDSQHQWWKVSPQTFLPTVKVRVKVNFEIVYIALAKSQSVRRASYQAVFMDSHMAVCLTCFCPVYLDICYEDSY